MTKRDNIKNQEANPITASAIQTKVGQRIPDKNVNGIWTKKLTQEVTLAGAGAGKTYGCIIKAPCPDFTHVRLVFANGEATPGIITDIAVASTNSNADLASSSIGNTLTNNGNTGWVRGTFSGSNGVTLPAAGSDVNNPGTIASDWIPLNSIMPIDGNSNPYLLARVLYSNTFSYVQQTADVSITDHNRSAYFEAYRTSGVTNAIATPSLLTNANKVLSTSTPFYAFEFLSSTQCIRTACVGDSITAGKHAAVGTSILYQYGWWQQAQDLFMAQNMPVDLFQAAVGGTTTSAYSKFGKTNITQHAPSVALYSLMSPNDNPSGAYLGGLNTNLMNTMYQTAMDFANYCLQNNCLPVFTVLTPNNSYSTTDDVFRLGMIERAKASSIPVIDLTPAVATDTMPQDFIAGLNDDAVHPNGAGYTAMANSFVTQFTGIIRQSFNI